MDCDYVNIIHMVKVQRLGEAHINRAKSYNAKAKAEATKQKRDDNDCKLKGIKNISRAIGGSRAKPLTCVVRDRDTEDGGLKGQITTNPQEVDAVVKREWQRIHNGMGGNIEKAVATFLSKYNEHIAKSPPFELPPLDAQTILQSFRQIPDSAAALDGWRPKELSMMSLKACGHIADMLNNIEAGAHGREPPPMPSSPTSKRKGPRLGR